MRVISIIESSSFPFRRYHVRQDSHIIASPSPPRSLFLDEFLDVLYEFSRIYSTSQHSTRIYRFRQDKKEKHTCRPNKSQLVRATRGLLRIVFLRKDVALQVGQVDDSQADAGQPCGREDLMSDESRPDWLPVTSR